MIVFKLFKSLLLLGLLILFMWACTYTNEEELYGALPDTCDSTNVTYAADILPVLQQNCYSCHQQPVSSGGVNLEGHSRVRTVATSGRLLGAITHASGFSPMPKNAGKLSDCDINKIRRWINQGALDN